MSYFYTSDPIAFYHSDVAETPAGAVPIDDADYWVLHKAQSEGKKIVSLPDGTLGLDEHPPPAHVPRNMIGAGEFLGRFTDEEREATAEAAMSNPRILLFFTTLSVSASVTLDSPKLAASMDVLVEAGIVTDARRAEIMAP
jgi:hypothetical protein